MRTHAKGVIAQVPNAFLRALPLQCAFSVSAASSIVLKHLDRHRLFQFSDHLDRSFALEACQLARSETGEGGRDPVSFLLAAGNDGTCDVYVLSHGLGIVVHMLIFNRRMGCNFIRPGAFLVNVASGK